MTTISQPQPQLSQLELVFKGPLVKDSIVDTKNDLITFNTGFNYPHKLVWVKEFSCNYYLASGDGSSLSHWIQQSSRTVISAYNTTQTYLTNDCVYQGGKIYSALQEVPINKIPSTNTDYWLPISGESATSRILFQNQSTINVFTDIKNPIFTIGIGTILYDENNEIVIDPSTGMAQFDNEEFVTAEIIRRKDIPYNNGYPYTINFYFNETLQNQIAGFINIK